MFQLLVLLFIIKLYARSNILKPKYNQSAKLCYMDRDSFIVYAKQMIFTKILQKMLKKDLTLQIMKLTDHYLKEKIKK